MSVDDNMYIYIYIYKGGLKSSHDDIISVVDNFLNLCDPTTATPLEEVCRP